MAASADCNCFGGTCFVQAFWDEVKQEIEDRSDDIDIIVATRYEVELDKFNSKPDKQEDEKAPDNADVRNRCLRFQAYTGVFSIVCLTQCLLC